MKTAGIEERDRIVGEAEKRAQAMRDEATFLIEQRSKQMREQLTREAIQEAVATAQIQMSCFTP